MKASRRIVAVLVAVALLAALGIFSSFWYLKQVEEASLTRRQTALVLSKTNDLENALNASETSVRGYLLTGDESFLDPYLTERNGLTGRVRELRGLASVPGVAQHLAVLGPLVDKRIAHLDLVTALYRNQGAAAAVARVKSGEGQRLMDSIRTEIGSIRTLEEDALAQREAALNASLRRVLTVLVLFAVFWLLLAALFAYLIYREGQQQLQNSVHLETARFLEMQEEANQQLQQANDTLLVSEQKLAVTLNSIGDAVIATDGEGLVALLNPLAEKLTGWTRQDAIGRPIDEIFRIVNEETREPALNPVAATLEQGTVHGLANHTIVIARDGSECSIADSCAPIRDRENQVVGAVLVFRDVTERTRLDQLLKLKNVELDHARTVAEEANLAKSEFLSSMSHELRSPLNAILGFAQLMASDSPPPTSEQQASIDQILRAGWHLLKLIDDILDLTKIESGQVSLSLEPVPLSGVLAECRGMIEPLARLRGIKLVFLPSGPDCFVRGDLTRVNQVLINLLSNAVKYNVEQGTVEVSSCKTAEGRIRVSVRDTGPGLSRQQLTQLFQAFNRLGQEASGVEGTGIGLVVAKQLVELMGGAIGAESTVGVGSVFWFELASVAAPSLEESAPLAVRANKGAARGKGQHTLLYIEDNPANLQLVAQIIERRPDLRLLTAVSGHDGIAVARESQPDAILMDINLPDISGLEALRLLRAHPATSHIPVVAVSANAMPRDVKRALDAGFFRYITKPIVVGEFMDALDVVLDFAAVNTDKAS